MNNPFKLIFIIFNLLPSIAPNNYSVPLPETELKMGQNVSELVKREESITLVGGTTVWGFLQGDSDNGELQRPCTLGFPVKNKEGRLGFLTSYACSDAGFFVQDDKNGLIEVGKVYPPNRFIGDLGLDYMFVSVYEDYWLDKTSQNMLYSIQCGESNELLSILPSTDITLAPNFKVCTFGGMNKEMVCGEILELDVTIQVPSSVNRAKKFINFAKVVKVNMTDDYDLGYLGAPVYIPIQVPNSNKFVASPVGQIIETFAQFNNEDNQDKKLWYYIPLDRILEYSGLKLDIGDLSFLLPPKPEESNNENLNDASLTDNLTASSNASDINLVERQEPRYLLSNAGFVVSFSSARSRLASTSKKCTLGFAIRRYGRINHGFLVLGDCLYTPGTSTYGIFSYYASQQNPGELEAVRIGTVAVGTREYTPSRGLNFALVNILPNDATNIYWDNDISTRIAASVGAEEGLVDVIPHTFVPSAGTRVCWWGGHSGFHCGEVVEPSTTLVRMNPWSPVPFSQTFRELIKVRLDSVPSVIAEPVNIDQGAPVYFPIRDDTGRVYRVRPVCILMDFTRERERVGNMCQETLYMYCVSVNKILRSDPGALDLIGTPPHQ